MITLILIITLVSGKLEEAAQTITDANQRFLDLQDTHNQKIATLQKYHKKEQLLAEYPKLQSRLKELDNFSAKKTK
jgi:hypothetical protein